MVKLRKIAVLMSKWTFERGLMFTEKKIHLMTPPQKNAKLRKEPWLLERNKAILDIKMLGNDSIARSIWSKFSGYNKRVTVEINKIKR